jgi:exopolysaccharide production protein ExoZ
MPRLASLQLMRALAAVMVLIGHVIAEAEHYMGLALGLGFVPWTRGVDLFFVISGFIITLSGRKWFAVPGGSRAFLLRRFIRVVPLYYLFTTLMLVTLVIMPGGVKETELEPGQVISSYLFLPWMRHDGRVAPILSLGWTLNYEIFFYLLFSVFLTLRRPVGLVAVTATITCLGLAGWMFRPEAVAPAFWLNPIIIEFAFGIVLAEVWLARQGRWPPRFWLGLGLLVLGFAGLIVLNLPAFGLPRFIAGGIPAMVILAGPVFFWTGPVADRLPAWGSVLGDSSYALYLSHRFVLRALTLILLPLFPATAAGAWAFVALACAAALGVSVLVFRHIETPMLAGLNRRFLTVRTEGRV